MIIKRRLLVSTIGIVMQIFYIHTGNVATKLQKKKSVTTSIVPEKQIQPFPLLDLPHDIQSIIGQYCLYNLNLHIAPLLFKQAYSYDRDWNYQQEYNYFPKAQADTFSYYGAINTYKQSIDHVPKKTPEERLRSINKNYIASMSFVASNKHQNKHKEYQICFTGFTTTHHTLPTFSIPIPLEERTHILPVWAIGCSDDGQIAAAIIGKKIYIGCFTKTNQSWQLLPSKSYDQETEDHFEKTVYIVIEQKKNMLWLFTEQGTYKTITYKEPNLANAFTTFCLLKGICKIPQHN